MRESQLRGSTAEGHFGVGPGIRVEYAGFLRVGKNVTLEGPSYMHCLGSRGVQIGSNTSIGRNLWLHCGGDPGKPDHGFFVIGEHSYIGCNAVIGAGGGITIGNHVLIGQSVNLHAENHVYKDATLLLREQGVTYIGIVIEDDVWIGSKVTVLDGVTVGRGAVIGAGAVVTRTIPPYSIALGVPATVIGMRSDGEI